VRGPCRNSSGAHLTNQVSPTARAAKNLNASVGDTDMAAEHGLRARSRQEYGFHTRDALGGGPAWEGPAGALSCRSLRRTSEPAAARAAKKYQ